MTGTLRRAPQRKRPRIDPASYRIPMPVTELIIYRNHTSHYLCPRCSITLEREFTHYCSRCGQCLDWRQYKKATCLTPGAK